VADRHPCVLHEPVSSQRRANATLTIRAELC
jgi:hypothetical protein